MDFKTMTTAEIIDLIRARRRVEHSVTIRQKKALVKELFERGKENVMCNQTLHDVLYSLLPACPNGNKELQAQQISLANELTSMLSEVPEEGRPDWTEFPADTLLDLLDIVNESSRPEAVLIARTLYEEIWYREMEDKVSEDTLYSYIRRQIPSTNEKSFRPVAEELVKILI